MAKIHLIMPMGGAGSRFFKNGFVTPKPLIEIHGYPFFYWATNSLLNDIEVEDLTFVVLQEHIAEFAIDKKILSYYPEAKIVVIPKLLNGAVLTCMEGVREISDNKPIIFNDCDHMFSCSSFAKYCQEGDFSSLDGALLTFTSTDPKYSFLELNEDGNVCHTVEKQAVSDKAICGAYYFRDKKLFLECCKEYLEKCSYSEYYVSGVYNVMAEHGMLIKNFTCDEHIPFGTPDEYKEALESAFFNKVLKK